MRSTADSADEDPDESGTYAEDVFDDEPGTVACPYCGEDVSEMAELCPHCRSYISSEDAPARPKPRWFVATAIVLLIVFSVGSLIVFLR